MDEKLLKYLQNKKLEDLASLRGLIKSIVLDYDNSLTTYATLNDDKLFSKMDDNTRSMYERRGKLNNLLMAVNNIIEEKLFKLYA